MKEKAGEDQEQSWKKRSSLDFKIIVGQFFITKNYIKSYILDICLFSNPGQTRRGEEGFGRGVILVAMVRSVYKACTKVSILS